MLLFSVSNNGLLGKQDEFNRIGVLITDKQFFYFCDLRSMPVSYSHYLRRSKWEVKCSIELPGILYVFKINSFNFKKLPP
jgi:hypothetical protein